MWPFAVTVNGDKCLLMSSLFIPGKLGICLDTALICLKWLDLMMIAMDNLS